MLEPMKRAKSGRRRKEINSTFGQLVCGMATRQFKLRCLVLTAKRNREYVVFLYWLILVGLTCAMVDGDAVTEAPRSRCSTHFRMHSRITPHFDIPSDILNQNGPCLSVANKVLLFVRPNLGVGVRTCSRIITTGALPAHVS
jgi:hypothetical protein